MKKRHKMTGFAWAMLLALLVWWHTSPAEALEGWATSGLREASAPIVITQLNQVAAVAPQVYIVSPRPEEVIADTTVAVQLQVAGTPIFKNSQLGLGPHLHLLLDRVPTESIYDLNTPITLSNLSPGTHTLQVLANKPWHESWKNPQAFAQVTFHVLAKSTDSPNAQTPQLISVQPQEVGAEPWLLDFYVANAPSHIDAQHPLRQIADWRVRATVNEQSFEVNRDEPIYLRGLRPGANVLKLEYLNDQGQVADSAVRLVKYQPSNDGLSRLVRNELSIDQALTLFDPQSRLAKAQAELSNTAIPSTQQPTMPWNQEVPSMPQANQGMQSNPVIPNNPEIQRNPVMQGNPGMYGNSGTQNNPGMYGNSGTQNNPGMYGNSGAQNNPGTYGNSGAQNNPGTYGNSGAQNNPGTYGNSRAQNNPGMYDNSGAQNNPGMYDNSGTQNSPETYGNSGTQNNPGMYGNSGTQNNPGLYGNSGAQNNPGTYDNSRAQNSPGLYDNSRAQNNPGTYDNSRAQSNSGMYGDSRAQNNPGMYDNSGTQNSPETYGNSRMQGNSINFSPRSTLPAPSRTFSNSAEIFQPKLPQTIAGGDSKAIAFLPTNPERKEIAANSQNLPPNIPSENIALLPPIQPQLTIPNPTEPKKPVALAPEAITGSAGEAIDSPVTKQPEKTTIALTPKVLSNPPTTKVPSPSSNKIISDTSEATAPLAPKAIAKIDPSSLPQTTSEIVVDFKVIGQELLHTTSVKVKQFTNQIPLLVSSWIENFRHWLSDRMAAMRANPSPTTSVDKS
jgi:hypothetical protein